MNELEAITDYIGCNCGWHLSKWEIESDASRALICNRKSRRRQAIILIFPDGDISIRRVADPTDFRWSNIFDGHLSDPGCFTKIYMALLDYERNI